MRGDTLAMSFSTTLANQQTIADMRNFLTRALAIDPRLVVRVLAKPGMLGLYAGVIYPPTLLDSSATVLGMRAYPAHHSEEFDAAFKASDILKSLETVENNQLVLEEDAVTNNAAWLGILPPLNDWEASESLSAELVREQAQLGTDAVAKALPDNPGHAVVETVRSRIWSSPLLPDSKIPTGVAFTAQALGFLPSTFAGELPVFSSGSWTRVNFPGGFVLAKS